MTRATDARSLLHARVDFRLLLITDGFDAETPGRVAAALGALTPGVAAVQLRAKTLSGRALLAAARALVEVAHAHGAPLVVNDRADIARAAGADGVHLPAAGLPVPAARALFDGAGAIPLVGASTHSLAEARAQVAAGADYLTFGPVFATPSKASFGPPLGVAPLAEACASLPVPLFALGGIDVDRAHACLAAGARLACIAAVLGATDPAAGARMLAATLDS